jgi:DNA-binding MarR family transcriptional regulator
MAWLETAVNNGQRKFNGVVGPVKGATTVNRQKDRKMDTKIKTQRMQILEYISKRPMVRQIEIRRTHSQRHAITGQMDWLTERGLVNRYQTPGRRAVRYDITKKGFRVLHLHRELKQLTSLEE